MTDVAVTIANAKDAVIAPNRFMREVLFRFEYRRKERRAIDGVPLGNC